MAQDLIGNVVSSCANVGAARCGPKKKTATDEFEFYRFETVEIPLLLKKKGVLVDTDKVVVTVAQGNTVINKFTEDLSIDPDKDTITLSLNQEETASFSKGTVELQINILYKNSKRSTSGRAKIEVKENLYKQVM